MIPWEFTIAGDNTTVTQWGANGSSAKKATWDSDESHVDAMFAKMKNNFISKGTPVILGEYSAMLKSTSDNPPFRMAWDKYITQAAIKIGMIPFYWDAGFITAGSSGLFDRNTGKQAHADVIKAMMSVAPAVSVQHKISKSSSERLVRSGNQLLSDGSTEICLYDLNGKLVRGSAFKAGHNVLSLKGLQGGLYVARIGSKSVSILAR